MMSYISNKKGIDQPALQQSHISALAFMFAVLLAKVFTILARPIIFKI